MPKTDEDLKCALEVCERLLAQDWSEEPTDEERAAMERMRRERIALNQAVARAKKQSISSQQQ
jgi:hypothetical protein